MRQANSLGARYALVLGAEELRSETVTLRDLLSSEQQVIPWGEAFARLRGSPPA
jgi:histidyl-tRNA synthetase